MKNLIRNFAATLALAANRSKTAALALMLCCASVTMFAQPGTGGVNCDPNAAVSFTYTQTADPLTLELTAVPTAIPVGNVIWKFGDGTPDAMGGITVQHTFPQVGVYPISVYIYEGGMLGCEVYNKFVPVSVGGCTMQARYAATINNSTNSVSFTGFSPIGPGVSPFTYEWKLSDASGFNDGATLGTSITLDIPISTIPQNRHMKLRMTDANGCVNEAIDSSLNYRSCDNLAFTLSFSPLPNNQTAVTPIITGGTPPYTYDMSWLDFEGSQGVLTSGTVITLGIGKGGINYFPYGGVNINIADANGCTLVANSCNSTNMALSLSSAITGSQVAWDLAATGGTPPYTYFSKLFSQMGGSATNGQSFYSALQNPVINGVGIGNNGASIHASVFDAHGCAAAVQDSIPFAMQNPACANSTCVFPGDANHDGAANLYDVLTLGVNYGDTGAQRTDQSLTWTAHEASDWTGITPTIVQNKKHADCNGNGTIDYIDTAAIGLNYHRTHNGVSPTNRPDMTGLPVFLQFEVDTAFLQTGVPNAIYADVFVGNSLTQANNLYGVAFSLTYPAALINPDSAVQVIYDNTSFMGNPNNILAFGRDLRADGQFDVALTRINHLGVGGNGRVCRIKWIITENISGKGNSMNSILTRLTETMQVTLSGVRINDTQLVPIASRGIGSSVVLVGNAVTATDEKAALSTLKIYPNPVRNGSLFINANSILIENYQLSNVLGQVVQTDNVQQNTTEINVQTLPSGVYFIRVATDKGVLTQKIVVAN